MGKLNIDLDAASDPTENLEWWSENLGGLEHQRDDGATSEYLALCPVHDDHNPSLVIFHTPSHPKYPIRAHCRACGSGKEFWKTLVTVLKESEAQRMANEIDPIITASPTAPDLESRVTFLRSIFDSPLQWYAAYCGIPLSVLQSLGMTEDREKMHVRFTWPHTARYKYRIVHQGTQRPKGPGQEVMFWSTDAGRPPLWPALPDELPEAIALCESESDCCVLRYWGFCAFALTAGGKDKPKQRVFDLLRARGARRMLLFYDLDDTGAIFRGNMTKLCLASDIAPLLVDISAFTDPFYGWQKDVRDLQQSGVFAGPDEANTAIWALLNAEAARQQEEDFDSLEHRAELAPEDPPWLVKNYISRGAITLISGQPGVGKTSILVALFAAMREGWDWLGQSVERTNVLYLTEEGITSLKAKRKIYGDMSHVFCMTISDYLDHDWPPDVLVTRILEYAKTLDVGLIVVDPLFVYFSVENESDPAQVKPLFRDYLRYIPRAGHALVVTAHDRKGGGDGINRVSGTLAIAGSCDIVLNLETDPLSQYRKCGIARSRLADPFTVMATTEGQKFIVVDTPDDVKQREADILRTLGDGKWQTRADLATALGLDENKMRRPLDRLEKQQRIQKRSVLKPRKHDEFRIILPPHLDLKVIS